MFLTVLESTASTERELGELLILLKLITISFSQSLSKE